jgi:hypothetical protein
MHKSGEVHILVRHTKRRDNLVAVLLQFFSVRLIRLCRQNLDWHPDSIDLLLRQKRRVSSGDSINERRIGSQLEDSPPAIAIPNSTNLGILGLQDLSSGLDFGESDLFAVATNESCNVESGTLFWVVENVCTDDFASETEC